ncbi:Dimethyladenosine transferase 1 [Mitosporidium daphniae]
MVDQLSHMPKIRQLLKLYGVRAVKQLSQNFILDPQLSKRVVSGLGKNLHSNCILEVGAGPGSLTRSILEEGPLALLAIEKDSRFDPFLMPLASKYKDNFHILFSDALKAEPDGIMEAFSCVLKSREFPITKFQIIANLPFSIATPLLVKWLQWMAFGTYPFASASSSMEMVLVVQKEVADRISSSPDGGQTTRIGVLSHALSRPEHLFDIPRNRFVPSPDVDAAVIKFSQKDTRALEIPVLYLSRFSTTIFGQKRKILRSVLEYRLPFLRCRQAFCKELIRQAYDHCSIASELRPQQLSVDQVIQLSTFIYNNKSQFNNKL